MEFMESQKKRKKAQTETVAVAVLIIVMAVFFVLYIISLPPSERERLLNVTASSVFLLASTNAFRSFTSYPKPYKFKT